MENLVGMKLISIIVPAYNEQDCIKELVKRLQKTFMVEKKYKFEVILIENGSTDNTWELIRDVCSNDSRFKSLQLSRNFRMDGGLTAGLDYVSGDACVLMTADLQDPPELISVFLRKWEDGWENVYGIVKNRQGINLVRRINSRLFYWIAWNITGGAFPKNASDFRLVDKKVYVAVRDLKEKNRFVRGLFAWVGFKSIGVEMNRPPRFGGISNAETAKVIDLAIKGLFAHSYKPLRLITKFGIGVSGVSILCILLLATLWLKGGVPFAGFGSIISLILLVMGLLALMLGIISEYVALIYEESKNRPNYILKDKIGFK